MNHMYMLAYSHEKRKLCPVRDLRVLSFFLVRLELARVIGSPREATPLLGTGSSEVFRRRLRTTGKGKEGGKSESETGSSSSGVTSMASSRTRKQEKNKACDSMDGETCVPFLVLTRFFPLRLLFFPLF